MSIFEKGLNGLLGQAEQVFFPKNEGIGTTLFDPEGRPYDKETGLYIDTATGNLIPKYWSDNNFFESPESPTSVDGYLQGMGLIGNSIMNLADSSGITDQERQEYNPDAGLLSTSRANFNQSAADEVKGIGTAIANPEETAQALYDVTSGALQHILPDSMSWNEQDKEMASAVGQIYKDRYGSIEGFKKSFSEDPVPVLLELTGAGLLTKAAAVSAASKIKNIDLTDFGEAVDNMANTATGGLMQQYIHPQYAGGAPRVGELAKAANTQISVEGQNLDDIPSLSIQDLEGHPFVTSMADRSSAGGLLTGVNDIDLPDPVVLRGGQDYMRNPINTKEGNLWASARGGVSGILNTADELKAETGVDPLFMPFVMKPTGIDFSHQTTEVMIQAARGQLNKTKKKKLDRIIKKAVPQWEGIDSPNLEKVMLNTTGDQRKAIQHAIDKDFRDDVGMSRTEARVAVSDPRQLDTTAGGLLNVGRIDLKNRRSDQSNHPSYNQALKGRPAGVLKEDIGAYDLGVASKMGRNVDPDFVTHADYRSLQARGATGGIIDDKVLRGLEDRGLLNNYKISHTSPQPDGKNSLDDMSDMYPDHPLTYPEFESHYGMGGDYAKADKEMVAVLKATHGKPDADITIYRAVPKGTKGINRGDWVSPSKEYARMHGETVMKGDFEIVEKKVKAGEIHTEGNGISEWGYNPKSAIALPAAGLLMAESQADEGNEQNETGLLADINDNSTLIDFLKEHEGFKEAGYYATDSEEAEGKVTVGYGSTGRVKLGEKVTMKQAEAWFKEDIASAVQHIDDLVTVELNDNQKMALISLVYNVGRDNLRKSKALKALNKGDFDTFMKEAFDPKIGFVKDKKGGTILEGLVKRRAEERKLFNK